MILTDREMDEAWDEMDGDDVVRILVQDIIDILKEARTHNWQIKVEEALKTSIQIYGTDRPIDGVSQ